MSSKFRHRVFASSESYLPNLFRTVINGQISDYATIDSHNLLSDTMADWVTPDWRELIARGIIINNPMTHNLERTTAVGGSYHGTSPYGWTSDYIGSGSVSHSMIAAFNPTFQEFNPYPGLTLDLELAKQQALAQVDSTPYAFLEDIAEFNKTANYLSNPMSTFRSLSRDFSHRRRQLEKIYTYTQALSQAWLEYRYALMPVAISISNIMNELMDTIEQSARTRESLKTRRTSRKKLSRSEKWNYDVTHYNSATDVLVFSHSGFYDTNSRAGILYDVTNPVSSFAERNGLRFKDVPRVAWNLIPFSWLVDRFVNISDFISGVVNIADPNVRILTAWTTHTIDHLDEKRIVSRTAPDWNFAISGDPFEFRHVLYERRLWTPSILDAIPPVGFRTGWKTLADVAALCFQNLR